MSEHDAARLFRKKLDLTLDKMSDMTGYSREAIFLFEKGQNSLGKPHAPHAWRRYKLACLAVRFMLHYHVESVEQWGWE